MKLKISLEGGPKKVFVEAEVSESDCSLSKRDFNRRIVEPALDQLIMGAGLYEAAEKRFGIHVSPEVFEGLSPDAQRYVEEQRKQFRRPL